MKWQEKWAILKMGGFVLKDHGAHRSVSKGLWFRYLCEQNEWEGMYGAGDTKAQAVNRVWDEYVKEKQNEMAREINGVENGGVCVTGVSELGKST